MRIADLTISPTWKNPESVLRGEKDVLWGGGGCTRVSQENQLGSSFCGEGENCVFQDPEAEWSGVCPFRGRESRFVGWGIWRGKVNSTSSPSPLVPAGTFKSISCPDISPYSSPNSSCLLEDRTSGPGVVAYAYNPNSFGGRGVDHLSSGVQEQPDQHGKTVFLLKNTISRAWWCSPVIPAIQEAEAEGSLEPGRQRLQRAKMAPLHSSLGDRARFHQQKKKRKRTKERKKLRTNRITL